MRARGARSNFDMATPFEPFGTGEEFMWANHYNAERF
jgi:hypothetical protein